MYKQVISLLALAVLTAGCNMASRSAEGEESFFGTSDPSGTFSSGGEARYAHADVERVRAVESQRARAAAESQDLAAQARYQVITAMRQCLTGERTCAVPPTAWTDIPEVSRGLAVDEAITVSASDGSGGYGYGEGDGFWRAQAAQMDGSSHAVPGWVSGNSQEVLRRLDQVEQRTEAVVRVQRDTSEELAGHLDRNRRSRRER